MQGLCTYGPYLVFEDPMTWRSHRDYRTTEIWTLSFLSLDFKLEKVVPRPHLLQGRGHGLASITCVGLRRNTHEAPRWSQRVIWQNLTFVHDDANQKKWDISLTWIQLCKGYLLSTFQASLQFCRLQLWWTQHRTYMKNILKGHFVSFIRFLNVKEMKCSSGKEGDEGLIVCSWSDYPESRLETLSHKDL